MSSRGDRGDRGGRGGRGGAGRGQGDSRGRGDSPGRGRARGYSPGRGRGWDEPFGRGRGGSRGDSRGGDRGGYGGDRGGYGGDRGGYRGGSRGDSRGDSRGGYRGAYRGGGGNRGQPASIYSGRGPIPEPDKAVTKMEDTIENKSKEAIGLASLQLANKPPLRPGFGRRGDEVVLWANLFEMKVSKDLVFHRYDIKINKAKQPKRKVTQVVKLLLETLFETPQLASVKDRIVTDYHSTLLSPERLDEDQFLTDIEIIFRDEDEDEPREGAQKYTVRLQYTNTLQVDDLIRDVMSTSANAISNDHAPTLQAFNILFNHFIKQSSDLVLLGSYKSFTFRGTNFEQAKLKEVLIALRGFYKSTRIATSRLLINVNVSSAAFYPSGSLVGLINKFREENGQNKYQLQRFLQKLRIRSTHLPEKKNRLGQVLIRPKMISGLADRSDGSTQLQNPPIVSQHGDGPNKVQFWLNVSDPPTGPFLKSGYITVAKFFQKKYGTQLNSDMPVINVGNKANPSYLPVEVCQVLPGQFFNRPLHPNQTREMLTFAVRSPAENAESIVEKGHNLVGLSSSNPLLAHFNIAVSNSLITVKGRVLTHPTVQYRSPQNIVSNTGSWNLQNVKFFKGGNLNRWSYLLITTQGNWDGFKTLEALNPVIRELHASLRVIGVNAQDPQPGGTVPILNIEDPRDLARLDSAMAHFASKVDLLFVVLPKSGHASYSQIKRLGDVSYGIHTICSGGEKLVKEIGRKNYLANIAMKFNLKLGGKNQIISNPSLSIIDQEDTMVVGLDVTHPSPGSKSSAPSIAAMVASVDKHLSQWPATIRIQSEARKEQVDDLSVMFTRHLRLWHEKHRKYPANILIYRDGVSEGENDMVREKELPQLRAACVPLYQATDCAAGLPRFTIVIVRNRHHIRFYPARSADADRTGNCKAGTVVDRGITEARSWEFYLQPHTALKGTARPAYYFILLDEVFRTHYSKNDLPPKYSNVAEILEDLTHSMSYAYGRATKAVRLCPPARYADMACARARCYLSTLFDDSARSTTTAQSDAAGNEDVLVHARMRNTMFYI